MQNEFRLQGLGMHWPMRHISSSKKMGLYGSQVLSSRLLIVRERVNNSVLLPWYSQFHELLPLKMSIFNQILCYLCTPNTQGPNSLLIFPAPPKNLVSRNFFTKPWLWRKQSCIPNYYEIDKKNNSFNSQ